PGVSRRSDPARAHEWQAADRDCARVGHERGDLAAVAQTGRSRRGEAQRWLDHRRTRGTAPPAPRESDPTRGARDPKKSRGLLRSGDTRERIEPVRVYEFVEREKVN